MTEIGQLLFDRAGSINKLGDIAECVANRRGDWHSRISPIDSALNGVGDGKQVWCS